MAPTTGSNSGTGRSRKVDRMTDEEAADFYYAQRGEQGDAATSVEMEAPRRLSRVISVRFDPEEAAAVEQDARRAGLTMSAYVRQAALGRSTPTAPDDASARQLIELLTQALRQAQVSRLLSAVADDVAHIRDKIGA